MGRFFFSADARIGTSFHKGVTECPQCISTSQEDRLPFTCPNGASYAASTSPGTTLRFGRSSSSGRELHCLERLPCFLGSCTRWSDRIPPDFLFVHAGLVIALLVEWSIASLGSNPLFFGSGTYILCQSHGFMRKTTVRRTFLLRTLSTMPIHVRKRLV